MCNTWGIHTYVPDRNFYLLVMHYILSVPTCLRVILEELENLALEDSQYVISLGHDYSHMLPIILNWSIILWYFNYVLFAFRV